MTTTATLPAPTSQHLGTVPILMYHSLCTASSPGFQRFTLSPVLFAEHLDYLAERGYRTLTVAQLGALRRGAEEPRAGDRRPAVVITFDDAFADFGRVALPLLASHGFTASLFVPTRYVGGRSGWIGPGSDSRMELLDWKQLREIADSGIECGSHSHSHPELDRVPPLTVEEEVTSSRSVLEDGLQRPVVSFAYPFGYFNRCARLAVAAAGYQQACAVGELASGAREDLLAMSRLSVSSGTGREQLAGILEAKWTRPGHLVSEGKRLAWRARRRIGHRRPAQADDGEGG